MVKVVVAHSLVGRSGVAVSTVAKAMSPGSAGKASSASHRLVKLSSFVLGKLRPRLIVCVGKASSVSGNTS